MFGNKSKNVYRLCGIASAPAFWHVISMRKNARREFNVIVERDQDGYYVASVPALPGCHTQARSLDKLIERIREAIELCLEVENEAPAMSEFIGVQRVTV
jgi:predicted RNase H-like HicB family nuclease